MAEVKGGGVIALDTSSLTDQCVGIRVVLHRIGVWEPTLNLLSGVHAHTGDTGLCYKLVRASFTVLWSGHCMEHQEIGRGASHHSVGVTCAFVGAEGLHQVHVWLRSRHVQSRGVQGDTWGSSSH